MQKSYFVWLLLGSCWGLLASFSEALSELRVHGQGSASSQIPYGTVTPLKTWLLSRGGRTQGAIPPFRCLFRPGVTNVGSVLILSAIGG